jgi:hypothetical protein
MLFEALFTIYLAIYLYYLNSIFGVFIGVLYIFSYTDRESFILLLYTLEDLKWDKISK